MAGWIDCTGGLGGKAQRSSAAAVGNVWRSYGSRRAKRTRATWWDVVLSLLERPRGQPQAEAERWAIRNTSVAADFGVAAPGFTLRGPDEMRLGCEPVLNGMQAILALVQARDRENRPARQIPSHSAVATASRYPSSASVVRFP